jgi:sugar (pentulose or hexulose) kinase
VVIVDEQGQPLYPAILWLDERQANNYPICRLYWQKLHQISGHQKTIYKLRKRAQANWFKAHRPEFWAKTHKFLLLSGYLTHKLTGEFSDAIASQVGYIPFDYKKHQWQNRFDWRWQALGLTQINYRKWLPSRKIIRATYSRCSATYRFACGFAIVAAGADKACEVLGAGCINASQGALSFGTTATYNTSVAIIFL